MDLTRLDGPRCPHCGCCDAKIISASNGATGRRWWAPAGKAVCNHCGRLFYFDVMHDTKAPIDTVPVPIEMQEPTIDSTREPPGSEQLTAIRCPGCGSERVKVTSTRKTIRHYLCHECQNRFKLPRRPLKTGHAS